MLKAVKAEAFNEKRTLFLFGSYTIGKEKLFLEVARSLKQKVGTASSSILCLPVRPSVCTADYTLGLCRNQHDYRQS